MKEKKNITRFYLYFNLILVIFFLILLQIGSRGYLSSNVRATSNLVILIIFGIWVVTNFVALIISLIIRQNLRIILASLYSTLTPLLIYIVALNSKGLSAQLTDFVMTTIILIINLVLFIIALKKN